MSVTETDTENMELAEFLGIVAAVHHELTWLSWDVGTLAGAGDEDVPARLAQLRGDMSDFRDAAGRMLAVLSGYADAVAARPPTELGPVEPAYVGDTAGESDSQEAVAVPAPEPSAAGPDTFSEEDVELVPEDRDVREAVACGPFMRRDMEGVTITEFCVLEPGHEGPHQPTPPREARVPTGEPCDACHGSGRSAVGAMCGVCRGSGHR